MGRPGPRGTSLDPSVAGSTATEVWGGQPKGSDPVAELLARGAGGRRIAAELNTAELQARQLLAEGRNRGHDCLPSNAIQSPGMAPICGTSTRVGASD
jgi:hypothetical protein